MQRKKNKIKTSKKKVSIAKIAKITIKFIKKKL